MPTARRCAISDDLPQNTGGYRRAAHMTCGEVSGKAISRRWARGHGIRSSRWFLAGLPDSPAGPRQRLRENALCHRSRAPSNPLQDRLAISSHSGPKPSDRTLQFLRGYNLADDLPGDPRKLLVEVEQIVQKEPSAEANYAAAEVAYIGGVKLQRKSDTAGTADLYAAAVVACPLLPDGPRIASGSQSL